ncbi:glycosyltransferase [Patiriisocius marinus]|uniref:glycosyltransferase n=1 Tax=Patiriisocius marinus TaxID=1397112 RepID=UPI0023310DFD|nr:glycosyltransferase [Patiriisocius marinus]
MRVVHVVKKFPVTSETFVSNHIAQCINAGIECIILADIIDKNSPAWATKSNVLIKDNAILVSSRPKKSLSKIRKLASVLKMFVTNIKAAKYFFKSRNAKYGLLGSSFKLWLQVPSYYKLRNADVFHSHFGPLGERSAILKDLGVITSKTVVSFYGYDTFSSKTYQPDLKKNYGFLNTNTNVYITNSQYLKLNLISLGFPEKEIHVNHVGLDPTKFVSNKAKRSVVLQIVSLGRLIKLKGQHLAIEALSQLKNPNISLSILGDGEEMENLKSLVVKYKLESQVTFYGSVQEDTIIKVFNESHLFLMTSITDEHGRAEGQGLVTAEAQACGLPVIAMDSGGVGETILDKKTGILIPENNVQALVDAIKYLYDNEAKREELASNTAKFIEGNFNQIKISEEIMKLY